MINKWGILFPAKIKSKKRKWVKCNSFPDKIKEVRGKGLLIAFEMYDTPKLDGHNISVELLKKGIYVKETHKSTVRIAPALTIEAWQIDNMAEAIRNVINEI